MHLTHIVVPGVSQSQLQNSTDSQGCQERRRTISQSTTYKMIHQECNVKDFLLTQMHVEGSTVLHVRIYGQPEIYVVDCCPALTKLQTNNFHAHLSCAVLTWKLLVSYPPNDALPPAVTIDRSCDCAICLISCPFTPQRCSTRPSRAPLKPVKSSSRRQLYRHLDEPLACLTSTSECALHASASSY